MMKSHTQQQLIVEGKQNETIEVPERSGLLITNCNSCIINVPGKSAKLTLERCTDVVVSAGSVVASLEIICCTLIKVTVLSCRSFVVDGSTGVALLCALPQSPGTEEEQGEQGAEDDEGEITTAARNIVPPAVAEKAEAVRLFTSRSEEVSIAFEGISGSSVGSRPHEQLYTYQVPKDSVYEKGDGPRFLSRVSVDRSNGGRSNVCKTLRCDQYGITLEELEAIEDGVSWTWEHGRGEKRSST